MRYGGSNKWPAHMNDLDNCLNMAGFEDVKSTGMHFTWSAGSGDSRICRKLDRVLINECWMDSFPFSEAHFLPPGSLIIALW